MYGYRYLDYKAGYRQGQYEYSYEYPSYYSTAGSSLTPQNFEVYLLEFNAESDLNAYTVYLAEFNAESDLFVYAIRNAEFNAESNLYAYSIYNTEVDAESDLLAYKTFLTQFDAQASLNAYTVWQTKFDAESDLNARVVFYYSFNAESDLNVFAPTIYEFDAESDLNAFTTHTCAFNGESDLLAYSTYQVEFNAESALYIYTVYLLPFEAESDLNSLTVWHTTFNGEALLDATDQFYGWAINLKTNAVSKYDNYNFYSFTGDKGADNSGIHLLDGTTDNGTSISGYIETGKMDFDDPAAHIEGMVKKRVTDVFVGMEGAKVDVTLTAGATTTTYRSRATTRLDNVKIDVGRGAEDRYWKMKIANVNGGQTTIDNVELIVRPSRRR